MCRGFNSWGCPESGAINAGATQINPVRNSGEMSLPREWWALEPQDGWVNHRDECEMRQVKGMREKGGK